MSSADPNNSKDASRNDSDQKRDAAAQPGGEPRARDLTADKQVGDDDFIPKFSSVRSKHEEEQWTQGSMAQATFDAPKPEAEPPLDVDMQEFGFHKDVIEQPTLFRNAVTPNLPSAEARYQSHLNQMQAPALNQAAASSEVPSSTFTPPEQTPVPPAQPQNPPNAPIEVPKQNQLPIASSPVASGMPPSLSGSHQTLLQVESSSSPIDNLPDDATELFESEEEKHQRVSSIRDSLYWITEEAQLVRHGQFNDYDPASEAAAENGVVSSEYTESHDTESPEFAPTVKVQNATNNGASPERVRVEQPPLNVEEAPAKPLLAPSSEPVDIRAQNAPSQVPQNRLERVDERRTTYDGKKNAVAEEPTNNGQLKKTLISVVSVVLLCVACVVITYDTIVVKKPADVKTESEPARVSPDKAQPQKEEAPKTATNASSVKEDLKKAFALEQKKNYIGALELFDLVLEDEANKSNAKALHGRGRVLTKLQRYERALEDLEAASDLDKGNELILIDLAAVKYLLADYSGAAREYERILSAHENDVDALYGRGISYAALGKNDEAIADFENVVKLKPNYDKAYRQMCTTFLAINQPDKAEAAITVAMKACGTDADLYFSRGLARYQMGRKEDAIEDYNEAILEDPKRKEYYNDRGYVLMELERTDEAKKDFRQALEIDPHYKLAVDNLARIDKQRKSKKAK